MNRAGHARGSTSLGLANALALLASVGAAAAYARWLPAESFGHWAAALAVARGALLLVDGGLKTALVRRPHWPGFEAMTRLQRVAIAAAVVMAAWVLARHRQALVRQDTAYQARLQQVLAVLQRRAA